MIKYKELKQKSKELERKYQLNHYELLQRFMFERILERISVSKYQENFILKGGLLLSALFGINNRTTRDMDTTIKGLDISKEQMVKVLNEILNIDLKDGVKFELVDVTDIREEDEYGGNKYHLIGKLENLKINLDIDISTGVVNSMGCDSNNRMYVYHPLTKKQIIGFKIPYWKECLCYIDSVARLLPTVRYVGWDIVIKQDGSFLLIEANDNADYDFSQIFGGGLWKQYKSIIKNF